VHRLVRCLAVLVAIAGPGGLRATGPADAKIDPRLRDRASAEATEILIVLVDQADVSDGARAAGKAERGRLVHQRLRDHAKRSQTPLLEWLRARGVEHRSFWIVNAIWARADRSLIREIARRRDVLRIEANVRVRADLPRPIDADSVRARAGIEWNVVQVEADAVWALGYTGQGVVIGGQDTGYRWSHPALRETYRGWDGIAASHAYNWHDAIHASSGPCGADAAEPCDDDGHGTHTMGSMVGDDGGVNQIGVAPGARWIGCRNMNAGDGTPATYTECFQWFVAPTDLDGQNADPSRAPDVINNSWRCPPIEGCSATTLRAVVENTRAAGIVVVSSAGNTGPGCASVQYPPALYDASLSVGATDATDTIASFSSRGPVTADGSGRRKPDVAAPGVAVRSAWPASGYATLSGTSMAGPHVAGLVALLLDARPDLRGRVDEIEAIVERTSVPLPPAQSCGGDIVGLSIPNHVYGHGRVDALAMLQSDVDGDGVSNLADCVPVDGSAWSAPDAVSTLRFDGPSDDALAWNAPANAGAATPVYDVVRTIGPDEFASAACLATKTTANSASDPDVPAGAFYYLVRVRNACGSAVAPASNDTPRILPDCF